MNAKNCFMDEMIHSCCKLHQQQCEDPQQGEHTSRHQHSK